MTHPKLRLITSAGASLLLIATLASTGCASSQDGGDERVSATSESALVTGVFPGSDGVCQALSVAIAGTTGMAVRMTLATGGCAVGALATTAGVGEPVCLVPAAGAALSGLAALLAGGAASLFCTTHHNTTIAVPVSLATTHPHPGQTCSDATLNHMQDAVKSGNTCYGDRRCTSQLSCTELNERIGRGSRCVTARRGVQSVCFDKATTDAVAQQRYAEHEAEIQNVLKTLQACKDILESKVLAAACD